MCRSKIILDFFNNKKIYLKKSIFLSPENKAKISFFYKKKQNYTIFWVYGLLKGFDKKLRGNLL